MPKPYPKQRSFIDDQARYTLIEAGTKTGKTVGLAMWTVMNAWNRPRTNWWWSAPVYPQTEIGFKRCIQLLPVERRQVNWSKLTVTLENGSTIQGKSGERPDNLYGDEVHGGVIDEASRYREESFHAFRTTLTRTKGPMKIIGNPKGRRNWFWLLCQKAKGQDDSSYSYHHLTTADNPYISSEEIENARLLLPAHVFAELYLGEAQEDEAGVFRNVRRLATGELLDGPLEDHLYTIGYDPARTQDNAVACVMDIATRQVVAFDVLPRASWEIQLERVVHLAETWRAPVLMDSTGLGDPLYEWLKQKYVQVEPFKFTVDSKQQLIENLAVDMERERVRFPEIRSLISELEVFEYRVLQSGKVQYSAPSGYTDDCVIALALANWAATKGRPPGDVGITL